MTTEKLSLDHGLVAYYYPERGDKPEPEIDREAVKRRRHQNGAERSREFTENLRAQIESESDD
jgi:hypothetical protein